MDRLPPPNWDVQPNVSQNGCFSANVPNCINMYVNGGLPFMQQSYNGYHSSQSYVQTTSYQTSVPRPSFRGQPMDSTQQIDESIRNEKCHPRNISRAAEFSCGVCERLFQTKQILEAHLDSHVKCDHEGCSFQASRKMMKLHFIQNHAKGKMRIKLDTPEEIAKWKEQRRKNYPTVANVKRKWEEEKARHESGQVAKTQNFRYRGKRGHYKPYYNQQKSKYQKYVTSPKHHENQNIHSNREGTHQTTTSAQPKEKENRVEGDPLSALLGSNNSGSDIESVQPMNGPPSDQPSTSNALQALCASYGGDSSCDESDTDTSKEVNNNNKLPESHEKTTPVKTKSAIKCLVENKTRRRKQDNKRKQENKNESLLPERKVTLLEKLLAPQIRHENNVILQCLRYIVNNDYFGVAQDSS